MDLCWISLDRIPTVSYVFQPFDLSQSEIHHYQSVNRFADEDAERDHQRREVATQATLYVAACLSCIGWIIAVRTLESMGLKRDDEQSIFWVLLLSNIFSPAQGLW
jgi:hypothetical protein